MQKTKMVQHIFNYRHIGMVEFRVARAYFQEADMISLDGDYPYSVAFRDEPAIDKCLHVANTVTTKAIAKAMAPISKGNES